MNFEKQAKQSVIVYMGQFGSVLIDEGDIRLVWFCKSLQNWKALCYVPLKDWDNYYFEVTYNGDKDEVYVDAYKKVSNMVVQ